MAAHEYDINVEFNERNRQRFPLFEQFVNNSRPTAEKQLLRVIASLRQVS